MCAHADFTMWLDDSRTAQVVADPLAAGLPLAYTLRWYFDAGPHRRTRELGNATTGLYASSFLEPCEHSIR